MGGRFSWCFRGCLGQMARSGRGNLGGGGLVLDKPNRLGLGAGSSASVGWLGFKSLVLNKGNFPFCRVFGGERCLRSILPVDEV